MEERKNERKKERNEWKKVIRVVSTPDRQAGCSANKMWTEQREEGDRRYIRPLSDSEQ